MSTENFENATVAPDGQPAEEQPVWRQEYPIDWSASEYVTRREFTRLLLVTSFAFVVGQAWRATMFIAHDMTVRFNFEQHWFQCDRMGLKRFS